MVFHVFDMIDVIGQFFLVQKSTGLYHETVTYVQDMDIFLGELLKIAKLKVTIVFQYIFKKSLVIYLFKIDSI